MGLVRGEIDVEYRFSKYFFVIAFLLNKNKSQLVHYDVLRLEVYTLYILIQAKGM